MPHTQLLLPRHRRQRLTNRLIALALLLVALTISEYLNRTELDRLEAFNRSVVLGHAASLRAALDTELNSTLYLASGLVGYLEVHHHLDPDEIDLVLASIFRQGRHLRNIGLAPNNRLDFIYPRQGNESAVGLFYPDFPSQWPAVKHAIDSHQTVLAGPVELLQGGRALVARTPVFLRDGSYWGLISVVLDFNQLLADVGFSAEHDGIRYALRGIDGKGSSGEMIIGDPALFSDNAVETTIKVPGGEWAMAALPVGGWDHGSSHLLRYRIGGWVMALLLALLYYRTARDRLQVELLGLHDSLTGLPNRRLFEDRVEQYLLSSQRHDDQFALLYLDLDGFKPINDQYGHKIGDLVLVEVAYRLRSHLRRTDTVARVGGDEFVMVLPRLLGVEEAMLVARKLVQAIPEPMTVGGHTVKVGASIGISVYPDHGATAEELLKNADNAMYSVKKSGKGNIHVASANNKSEQD